MRLTLEELRAMSDQELYRHWSQGSFPFELANCGTCLTQHTLIGFSPCMAKARGDHDEFTRQIKAAIGENAQILNVREHLEEIFALRLFYDSLYQPVPAAEPAVAAAEQNIEETTAQP